MNIHEKCGYIEKNVMIIPDETHPLYIVKGEKNFLIDSGITAKAKKYCDGIAACLEGGKIDTLLLTHSHYDHVGAGSYLQDIYNFNVIASFETSEMLENPDINEMINFQNREMKETFADFSDINYKAIKKIDIAVGGEKIRVSADSYFEVIPAPGHSVCSTAYLLLPGKMLFPGDSAGMMEKNGRKRPVFFAGYKAYENTLLKFAEIEPEIIAFSHASYIKGKNRVSEYIKDSLTEAQKVKDYILFALKRKQTEIEIAEDMVSREFFTGSVMGRREAYVMHVMAMVRVLKREFKV